jgi:hypothetical protein
MNLVQHRGGSSVSRPGEHISASGADVATEASAFSGEIAPDRLEEASEESFPASDAPAWTPVTGTVDGFPQERFEANRPLPAGPQAGHSEPTTHARQPHVHDAKGQH